ncbi:hypothetical protein [Pseudorhodoferax sp.]|jgi:hypothetical protein|nr:hypothetical protein [Pseudorhodoferax sp.]
MPHTQDSRQAQALQLEVPRSFVSGTFNVPPLLFGLPSQILLLVYARLFSLVLENKQRDRRAKDSDNTKLKNRLCDLGGKRYAWVSTVDYDQNAEAADKQEQK